MEKEFNDDGYYRNPLIGSLIPDSEDYLKLCARLCTHYLSGDLEPRFVKDDAADIDMSKEWHKTTGRARWVSPTADFCKKYPIMILDDVEIHWIHERCCDVVLDKFQRRLQRFRGCTPVILVGYEFLYIQKTAAETAEFLTRFTEEHDATASLVVSAPKWIADLMDDMAHRVDGEYGDSVHPDNPRNENGKLEWSNGGRNVADNTFRDGIRRLLNI